MNTIRHITRLLILLLTLLPFAASAQQLTGYEYWFDGDIHNRVFVGLSGTEANIDADIATDGLTNGLHTLFLRFKQSGGEYNYSSVTTSSFFKVNMTAGSKIEYWVDGNFDARKYVEGHVASTGDAIISTEAFDLSDVPAGMHRVYYRLVGSDGITCSAVSMTPVMVGGGETAQLEYWFDGQRGDNTPTLTGHSAESGDKATIFNETIDLSSLSSGMHRMYYRGVNSNGISSTAVSMTPVMVKSRYNFDGIEPKVVKYSVAVDNEEPVVVSLQNPANEITIPYSLNANGLSSGTHTVTAKAWNNAQVGVSEQATFNVVISENPTLTLNAQEQDGLVKINMNTVPNDVRYRIIRRDGNGTRVKVSSNEGGCYPINITCNDNPPVGIYTYSAQMVYINSQGEKRTLESNEVTINIAAPQTEEVVAQEFGSLNGSILIGGSRPTLSRVVHFSDGVDVKTNIIGCFYRTMIPVGTTLTLTVDDEYSTSFEEATVTINAKTNYITINGEVDVNKMYADTGHDLQFDSFTEITPGQQLRFSVKNISRFPWTGHIRVKTIKKEYADNPPDFNIQRPTDAHVLAGSVAPFEALQNYDIAWSEKITIQSGQSADVYIKHVLSNWPASDEYYYFYFESLKNDGGEARLIATNPDYNLTSNPHLRLIERSECVKAADAVWEEDILFTTDFIMGACSTINELDGKLGDLTKYLSFLKENLGYGLEYVDYDWFAHKIDLATNYSYIRDEVPSWKLLNIVFNENNRFLKLTEKFKGEIADLVRDSKDLLGFMKDVKACLDFIQDYDKSQNMTTEEQIFALSDRLLKYTAKDPFSKLLKTYLDVTEKSIENALLLGEQYHSNFSCEYFSEQNLLSDSERESAHVYKQNKFYDFKIRVKRKGLLTGTFSGERLKQQLYNVTVTAINHNPNDRTQEGRATMRFEPIATDDGVYLRQIGIEKQGGSDMGYYLYMQPIEDMWMNIEWANGRVSRVPLRHGGKVRGDGVKFDGLTFPFLYTVSFQSGIKDQNQSDHLADIIYLDD